MPMNDSCENYLAASVRDWIEEKYYARINEQARLKNMRGDSSFWSPELHVAWYSDHGVVHVRDVAKQVVQVLDMVNGVLIPARSPEQVEGFMKPYAVMLAYLHDIGMVDFSAFGRAMHPEYASQAVFTPEFDDVVESMYHQEHFSLERRLGALAQAGLLTQAPQVVFRELLALATCHSKSKVPPMLLNDPQSLRNSMQTTLSSDLRELFQYQNSRDDMQPVPDIPLSATRMEMLGRFNPDFTGSSFEWLVSTHPQVMQLAEDAIDCVRALRCADAFRQRGTLQKTSGGYEIFINQQTANVLYAFREGDEKLFLVEINDAIASGEANIASSELTPEGNLRVSFHRGSFSGRGAIERAAFNTAVVVNDIAVDVIGSFTDVPGCEVNPTVRCADDIQVLLESTDDNPGFTELVMQALSEINEMNARRVVKVPSLQNASALEIALYLQSTELEWDLSQRQALVERLVESGQKKSGVDLREAFRHVRLGKLKAGQVLIEAGSSASFVYLPLEAGLKVVPLGGYAVFRVNAWMPLGNTAVIRGATRNADVVADQDVEVLIIPKEVYLEHWYRPYSVAEFKQIQGD